MGAAADLSSRDTRTQPVITFEKSYKAEFKPVNPPSTWRAAEGLCSSQQPWG